MNGRQKNRVSTAVFRLLYIIGITLYFCMMAWLLSGCERREMYVYGDEYQSVELEVNWRKYADTDPDGMTVWFYPMGNESLGKPYRTTTASVRHTGLYLPGGLYNGVVVDYSPEEYSRQRFVDMDELFSARVEATPATYQPDTLTISGEGVERSMTDNINTELFGDMAWTSRYESRPTVQPNGLYTVASQPEEMALDTLSRVVVGKGEYGDYIPWQERDTYQQKIDILTLHAEPKSVIWKARIRVYIAEGFNYIWQIPASITGLSNGHYLVSDRNTDMPCILAIDSWDLDRTGENSGYISTTITTFGLCPGTVKGGTAHHIAVADASGFGSSYSSSPVVGEVSAGRRGSQPDVIGATTRAGESEPDGSDSGWDNYITNLLDSDAVRLNLAFTLRDHKTTLYYHFNVGRCVVEYEQQLVLRVDVDTSYFDPDNPDGGGPDVKPIVLPYVEALNGTGFDANVTEWQEGGTADTTM